jgi:hypothetical protein
MNRFNAFGCAVNFAGFTWMIGFLAYEVATGRSWWVSATIGLMNLIMTIWCFRDIEDR